MYLNVLDNKGYLLSQKSFWSQNCYRIVFIFWHFIQACLRLNSIFSLVCYTYIYCIAQKCSTTMITIFLKTSANLWDVLNLGNEAKNWKIISSFFTKWSTQNASAWFINPCRGLVKNSSLWAQIFTSPLDPWVQIHLNIWYDFTQKPWMQYDLPEK